MDKNQRRTQPNKEEKEKQKKRKEKEKEKKTHLLNPIELELFEDGNANVGGFRWIV